MPRISGTVSGLDPETTYEFQVRVVDAFGNVGDWSNVATGTTLAAGEADFLHIWMPFDPEAGTLYTQLRVSHSALGDTDIGMFESGWVHEAAVGANRVSIDGDGNHAGFRSDRFGQDYIIDLTGIRAIVDGSGYSAEREITIQVFAYFRYSRSPNFLLHMDGYSGDYAALYGGGTTDWWEAVLPTPNFDEEKTINTASLPVSGSEDDAQFTSIVTVSYNIDDNSYTFT